MASSEHMPMSLDVSGLPHGLPDQAYATWRASLSRVRESETYAQGEKSFEFCTGFLQALQDTQVVDERLCRFLKTQLQERWVDVLATLRPGL